MMISRRLNTDLRRAVLDVISLGANSEAKPGSCLCRRHCLGVQGTPLHGSRDGWVVEESRQPCLLQVANEYRQRRMNRDGAKTARD